MIILIEIALMIIVAFVFLFMLIDTIKTSSIIKKEKEKLKEKELEDFLKHKNEQNTSGSISIEIINKYKKVDYYSLSQKQNSRKKASQKFDDISGDDYSSVNNYRFYYDDSSYLGDYDCHSHVDSYCHEGTSCHIDTDFNCDCSCD